MKVVNAKQMQDLDKYTIEKIGIPGVVLMENAGRQVVEKMLDYFPNLKSQKVVIICGKGNNGGDGLVISRYLATKNMEVEVLLLSKADSLKGDARVNCQIAQNLHIPIYEIQSEEDFQNKKGLFLSADVFVDALFGTGFTPPVKGLAAEIIQIVNNTQKPVVSVDIPSGLSSDLSHPCDPHIKAKLTVTFALPKLAHLLPPSCLSMGKLEIVDIGIPEGVVQEAGITVEALERDSIGKSWPSRSPDSHKGAFGHLFVIAGSLGKTGAAFLCSQAAARLGTGLITLGIPESLNSIMEEKLTEVMTIPLPETDAHTFSIAAKEKIKETLASKTAIAFGPGISTHPEVQELMVWLIGQAEIPIVIDADGINVLAGFADILKEAKQPVILTPHPKELSRLIGVDMPSILKDRLAIVQKTAQKFHCYVILKGYHSLIADPEGKVFINTTGNAGMATGGTGDVLTGIIGGLLAQGFSKTQASLSGVFLHGLSGDMVTKKKGEFGLMASDLVEILPEAIEEMRKGNKLN